MNNRILTILLLLCLAISGKAEGFYSLSVGGANVLDTYLSPERYSGVDIRLGAETLRESKKHPLSYLMTHELSYANTKNRVGNATMHAGHYDFSYGIMRKWELMENRLTIRAGGMVDFYGGYAYCTRNNANNPAQGYAALGIGPEVMAQYRFTLWNKAMQVGYTMRMPWVGMMFSPNYGQSYYEIFNRGDYDHNIVFTSIATFQMRQQIYLDVNISERCALRVGYLSDIRQATPNNLKQHQWYNAGMIGVVIK